MRCVYCKHKDLISRVIDSRMSSDGLSIRRRRECENCGKRFTTYETLEDIPFKVIKKDKIRAPFDRNKLLNGLRKACEKRPVSEHTLQEIVTKIEQELVESFNKEVPTREIGERLMRELKLLDQVAYVRFASVYREFKDVEEFMEELRPMLDNPSSTPVKT
ncbi:MAG: transcriptional regulator NrdR [Planctomycetota bacterium]